MNSKTKSANLHAVARVFLRTVLPVVVGLGLLIVIIAALAGAFNEKIEPARQEVRTTDVTGLKTEAEKFRSG